MKFVDISVKIVGFTHYIHQVQRFFDSTHTSFKCFWITKSWGSDRIHTSKKQCSGFAFLYAVCMSSSMCVAFLWVLSSSPQSERPGQSVPSLRHMCPGLCRTPARYKVVKIMDRKCFLTSVRQTHSALHPQCFPFSGGSRCSQSHAVCMRCSRGPADPPRGAWWWEIWLSGQRCCSSRHILNSGAC